MSKLPAPSDILGPSFRLLPDECQLLLVTSVLGTSPTWLLQSFAHNTLVTNDTPLVLVSFMNDYEYFKNGLKRAGVDLASYTARKKFVFIDGLSNLFAPNAPSPHISTPIAPPPITSARVVGTRAPVLPARGAALPTPPTAPSTTSAHTILTFNQSSFAVANETTLKSIQTAIESAIQSLSTSNVKPVLIIDAPDILLAATSLTPSHLESLIYDLRTLSSSAILFLASDTALVSQDPRTGTELEVNQAAFVVGQMHVADAVVGLRLLDTGVARDVSGVMRITVGGGEGVSVEEKECLWFGGDGGVRLFGRGES